MYKDKYAPSPLLPISLALVIACLFALFVKREERKAVERVRAERIEAQAKEERKAETQRAIQSASRNADSAIDTLDSISVKLDDINLTLVFIIKTLEARKLKAEESNQVCLP